MFFFCKELDPRPSTCFSEKPWHHGYFYAIYNFEQALKEWRYCLKMDFCRRYSCSVCVLVAIFFCIFILLWFAFHADTSDIYIYIYIYIHTGSDGKIYNINRLRAKPKRRTIVIRDLLFPDNAALAAHSEEKLQLIGKLSYACANIRLLV